MIITADQILLDGALAPGWVHLHQAQILGAGHGPAPSEADEHLPGLLSPGFVDVHCHGGAGAAFGTDDPADVATALALHRAHGTTTTVASLVTASPATLRAQLDVLAPFVDDGDLLGIHLEGPWLDPGHAGAHDVALMGEPDPDVVRDLVSAAEGRVSMVTLAPELPGAQESTRWLASRGVVVAVGHTGADAQQTRQAIEWGATGATHLFNAMPPLHHRAPGPILALSQDPRVWLELIADGVHVDLGLCRHVMETHPDRTVLITDAMSAAGCADGRYRLGDLPVTVTEGVARLTDGGAIAGSTLTLDRAVRGVVAAGVPAAQALRAATELPARYLGAEDVGRLAGGCWADLVWLDESLQPQRVMRRGQWLSD